VLRRGRRTGFRRKGVLKFSKVLEGIHPAAEVLLALEQVLDGLGDLGIGGGDAGGGEAQSAVPGLEFDLSLIGFETHRPLAGVALEGEDALRVGLDLRGVLRAIDFGKGERLVAEVDHVLRGCLSDHAGEARSWVAFPEYHATSCALTRGVLPLVSSAGACSRPA